MRSRLSIYTLQKSTSDQFRRLFLRWFGIEYLPSPETHRRSHHLPNDLRLLRMLKAAHWDGRQWVRLQDDAIATNLAPGTDKTITSLDEVNGTLELRPPKPFRNLILGFIDLHETPRGKNRVHREVFCSDVTVGVSVVGQCGKIRERHHSP